MAKRKKGGSGLLETTLLLAGHADTGYNSSGKDERGFPRFILTEDEKYYKDKEAIKRLFLYNESLCLGQIRNKTKKYEEALKLSKGVINKEDYLMGSTDDFKNDYDIIDNDAPKGVELEFFPIIPNIVNALKQELSRKYVNFHPKAIDSESINETINALNESIREDIISTLKKRFTAENEGNIDPQASEEQKQQIQQELDAKFQNMPNVQKAFSANYKPEIVEWAEHLLERDNHKFDMTGISRDVFEDQLLINERYLHVNHLNKDYLPEWIAPDKVGFVKSPSVKCVSDATCVHFLEYLNIQGVINKYGYMMSAEDIEKCTKFFTPGYATGGFMIDDPYAPKKYTDTVSMNNYNKVQSLIDGRHLPDHTIEIAHQYFIVPRKLGKLTVKEITKAMNFETNEQAESTDTTVITVDDKYKTSSKIVNRYEKGKPKTGEYLIEGEHVDWFYINEVWRGIRLRVGNTPIQTVINMGSEDGMDYHDIWIYLDKAEYQGRPEDELFGTKIPIFGGPVEYKREHISKSLVDVLAPFQKYYNYLMNKIKELVITELMPFYVINKELIGAGSLEDSWQDDPLFKFVITGQETGISMANTTDVNIQAMQAFQQNTVINLDRSAAIKTRWELAQLFKNEGYATVGLSQQFLGDVGKSETATGVNAGIQQSTLQIQHLFDSHFDLMKNVLQYMIELAQVIHFKQGGMIEMSYIDSDTQTKIFKMEADKLPLTKRIGVFIVNSVKENEMLYSMKQLAMQDNTMGADGYEKALIMTANSQAQLLDRLKKQQEKRDKQAEAQQQAQQDQLKQQIEADKAELKATQDFEAKENQLDRELKYLEVQIQTLGWAKDSDANDNGVLDMVEISKADAMNTQISNNLFVDQQKNQIARETALEKLNLEKVKLEAQKQQNLLNFQATLSDIRMKKYMKDIDLKIAKENKTKAEMSRKK